MILKTIKTIKICVLFFLAFAASAYAEEKRLTKADPLEKFELGKYQYCGTSKDCVHVRNGCCDCANGGEDVAINKKRLKEFKERFDCSKTKCGLKLAIPECGSGVVTCLNHKCKYITAAEYDYLNKGLQR